MFLGFNKKFSLENRKRCTLLNRNRIELALNRPIVNSLNYNIQEFVPNRFNWIDRAVDEGDIYYE